MAGDKFNLAVNSWWKSANTPSNTGNPLTDLVSALNSTIGGISGVHGGATAGELQSSNVLSPSATNFLNSQTYTSTKPKAYINWVLFDEQFNYVSSSSGFEQVGASNTYTSHSRTNLPIDKNGYLYIYVSNVTDNIDVFFDNLQVTHVRGPVLEETHYYPFGLVMAGISSKALVFGNPVNKKNKFQNQELNEDLGVEIYEFKYRMDDLQIGRFWQVDPLADKYVYNSTYAFSENKVTSHVELEGLEAQAITDGAWRDLQAGFQHLANWVDNAFSFGSKAKVETPISRSTGNSSNTLTVEITTSTSTNAGPFMSFVIQNNTNEGYTGDFFKTTTTNTVSVGTKIEVNTPAASGALSASTDQNGKITVSGTGSVKTSSGLNVGANVSTSSDGTKKVGANASISSGNTTGKAGVTVSTNGKTSSVESSISAEQKVKDTKVTQTFFFKIGW